jgi:hypothetical protein
VLACLFKKLCFLNKLKILFTHLNISVDKYNEPILIIESDVIKRLIKKYKGIKYLYNDTIFGILNIRVISSCSILASKKRKYYLDM